MFAINPSLIDLYQALEDALMELDGQLTETKLTIISKDNEIARLQKRITDLTEANELMSSEVKKDRQQTSDLLSMLQQENERLNTQLQRSLDLLSRVNHQEINIFADEDDFNSTRMFSASTDDTNDLLGRSRTPDGGLDDLDRIVHAYHINSNNVSSISLNKNSAVGMDLKLKSEKPINLESQKNANLLAADSSSHKASTAREVYESLSSPMKRRIKSMTSVLADHGVQRDVIDEKSHSSIASSKLALLDSSDIDIPIVAVDSILPPPPPEVCSPARNATVKYIKRQDIVREEHHDNYTNDADAGDNSSSTTQRGPRQTLEAIQVQATRSFHLSSGRSEGNIGNDDGIEKSSHGSIASGSSDLAAAVKPTGFLFGHKQKSVIPIS